MIFPPLPSVGETPWHVKRAAWDAAVESELNAVASSASAAAQSAAWADAAQLAAQDAATAAQTAADLAVAAAETATAPTDTMVAALLGDENSDTGSFIAARTELVVGLPRGTGADDTTSVQAILDTPGPKRVVGRRGETYRTRGWSIPSDTTLDMTDCIIERLPAGRTLLRNSAYKTADRDRNITVIGGTWNHRSSLTAPPAGDPNNAHTLIFHRVDGVRVEGATITNDGTNVKYSLYFCDVSDYSAERIRFRDRSSDGIHVTGPAARGRLVDLAGYTGDDFVGVTGRDYVNYNLTPDGGDVVDLTIENITLENGGSGVLLVGGKQSDGTLLTVRDVVVRDVRGYVDSNTIRLVDDPIIGGGIWDNILLENISAGNRGGGYGMPIISNAVGGDTGSVFRNITVRNVHLPLASNQILITNARVENLVIDGVTATQPLTGSAVKINSGSVVGHLTIMNIDVPLATGRALEQQGQVDYLNVAHWAGGGGMLIDGPTALIHASDIRTAQGITLRGSSSTDIRASNIHVDSYNAITCTGNGARTLHGNHVVGGNSSISAGTGALRATGVGVRVNATQLTPQDGDSVYNTDLSTPTAPAVGLMTYTTGAGWVHAQGWFRSGTATLVAGEVVVSSAQVKAGSRIRLLPQTPSANIGYLYTTAVTDGAFTIRSTNPADTSVVRWELYKI